MNLIGRRRTIGSQWLRLWNHAAACGFALLLVACSDTVSSLSGEWRLDLDATENQSPVAPELLDDVVLTLNTDRSFGLTGKFNGVTRTQAGSWSLEDKTISLRFTDVRDSGEQYSTVATVAGRERAFAPSNKTITFDIRIQDREVTAVFRRAKLLSWSEYFVIIALVVIGFVALSVFASKEQGTIGMLIWIAIIFLIWLYVWQLRGCG